MFNQMDPPEMITDMPLWESLADRGFSFSLLSSSFYFLETPVERDGCGCWMLGR